MNGSIQLSWPRRNWKGLLAVACVVALAILLGGILVAVRVVMTSSDVYRQAVATARAAPAVAEALGTPVAEGWFVTGHISVSGSSGNADLAIPLSGPKSKGRVFLVARKSMGEWRFSKLVFATSAGERTDLLRSTSVVSEHAPGDETAMPPVTGAGFGAPVPDATVDSGSAPSAAIAPLLDDLMRRLGSGTDLERLRIDEGGRLELRAFTAGSAKLAADLAESTLLIDAQLQDAVADARTKNERVSIVAGVRKPRHAANDAAGGFLAAGDSSGAYTEVTQHLQQTARTLVADASSCTTVSTSVHPDASDGPLRRAVVQVRMRCELKPLTAILSALESGRPDLFIGQFDLTTARRFVAPGTAEPPHGYDVRFDVFGYLRPQSR